MPSRSALLFPCLKPSDWTLAAGTVSRRLWNTRSSEPGPWLAFGYDHPEVFEFLQPDQLTELHTNAQDVETQALAYLRTRPVTWKATTVNVDGFEHLSLLVCDDDFLAAERILDADFMREAQTTLRASALLVGIPRRGVLMATRADEDGKPLLAFALVVKEQCGRAESAPVTPRLFVVKDGAIAAMLDDITSGVTMERVDDAPAAVADVKADDSQSDGEDAPFISTIIARNDRGSEDVHLLAGGPNGARLAKAIETTFRDVIVEHLARAEFSGHVQIVVLAMTPRSERKYLPPLLQMLRETCSTLSTRGARCTVSLTYQASSLPSPAPAAPAAPAVPAPPAPAPAVRAPTSRAVSAVRRDVPHVRQWVLAAVGVILVAVLGFQWYSTHDSFPEQIDYRSRRLKKTTGWTRDGISGAVFVSDEEHLPTASVQIGVMISGRRPTADALEAWIREEYAKSPTDKLYDAGPGTETCKIGVQNFDRYAYTRVFVAVQVCKTGNGRAACAEDDEPISAPSNCGTPTRNCYEAICDSRRRYDGAALAALVDQVLTPR